LRDNTYDMVGFQELMKYGRKSGVQLGDFDIGHFAAAFGATGIRVTSMHEFVTAFKQSLDEPGINIIDARVDYSRTIDLYAHLHEGVLN
jgi:acetolactate synthase-1/2/3 large subunit